MNDELINKKIDDYCIVIVNAVEEIKVSSDLFGIASNIDISFDKFDLYISDDVLLSFRVAIRENDYYVSITRQDKNYNHKCSRCKFCHKNGKHLLDCLKNMAAEISNE